MKLGRLTLILMFAAWASGRENQALAGSIKQRHLALSPDALLDCRLRLEGTSPNFRLVHSQGSTPVPANAVKKIYGNAVAYIAVETLLFGKMVEEVRVPYRKANEQSFTGFGESASYPQISELAFLMHGTPIIVERHLVSQRDVAFEDVQADGPIAGRIVRRTKGESFPKFELSSGRPNVTWISYICQI